MNFYLNKLIVVAALLAVLFLLGLFGPGHIQPEILSVMVTAIGGALAMMLPFIEKKKTGTTVPPGPPLAQLVTDLATPSTLSLADRVAQLEKDVIPLIPIAVAAMEPHLPDPSTLPTVPKLPAEVPAPAPAPEVKTP